jgi:hypothetical protein
MTNPAGAWHGRAQFHEAHAIKHGDLLKGMAAQLFVELLKHEFAPGKAHVKTKEEADYLRELFSQNEKLHKLGFPALDIVTNGKNVNMISRARNGCYGWSDEPWLET